jgi:hypothetical protein
LVLIALSAWQLALAAGQTVPGFGSEPGNRVGEPADLAPSAYHYRADRAADQNDPESWILVLRHAGLPLDRPGPADTSAPAVRQVIRGLVWEESRQVRTVEAVWPAGKRPAAEEVALMYADNAQWWFTATKRAVAAEALADGRTLRFSVPQDTCGVLLCAVDAEGKPKDAAGCTVPEVRAYGPDTWKQMDLEIEWGYEPARSVRPYDGEISVYNGALGNVKSLGGDDGTIVEGTSFRSARKGSGRRGLQLGLLYVGTSPWRKMWPNAPTAADLPRTVVTVKTSSGGFSFLAADLENGPILAPEHGFFVRATKVVSPEPTPAPPVAKPTTTAVELLGPKVNKLLNNELSGWGTGQTPFIVANAGKTPITISRGFVFPAQAVFVHPGPDRDAAIAWRSPISGKVHVQAVVASIHEGAGDGVAWTILKQSGKTATALAKGAVASGRKQASTEVKDAKALADLPVEKGDVLIVAINRRGSHTGDSTNVELVLQEKGGQERKWDLAKDVAENIQAGNPHADSFGNADVWSFCTMIASEPPVQAAPAKHEPPFDMRSSATSAAEFIKQLQAKGLKTIRQRTGESAEMSWEAAMKARFGEREFPPIPETQQMPSMRLNVPCERLAAQWNLGVWHNLRTAKRTPKGEVRLADHPYAVLAQETFQMVHAIDLAGMHKEAREALDLWLDLPLKVGKPAGLFADGEGVFSGIGYEGPHVMGPGTIGWIMAEHYRLTGDKDWLKAKAPRMLANVRWILRQRKLLSSVIPGGERLWSKGLQPAHSLTPDAGGFWAQFYASDAYYWLAVRSLADVLAEIDPDTAAELSKEADAYRADILAAVERSILYSPLIAVRDGTYRTFIPPVCHARGPISLAWMWKRKFSLNHWDGIAWDISMGAMDLIDPTKLLPVSDVRVRGHMAVLEDRFLLENRKVFMRSRDYDPDRDWYGAGWHHQCAYERNPQIHLLLDDVPCFLRGMLNQYAAHICQPQYTFNEHTTRGPPDKPFEEAGFMERFRDMLVMEEGESLWLARATPRAWLEQGKKISVKNAPTHFGTVAYEIVSDVDNGKINATVEMPSRNPPKEVVLRFRHPKGTPIKSVTVNGKPWTEFNKDKETITLKDLTGAVAVSAQY